jgi:predicted GNAT family N-acyltransferase
MGEFKVITKNELTFKIIPFASADYDQAVALRQEILRKPLGLSFTLEELEDEKHHIHIAGFLNGDLCVTAVLVPDINACKMQRVATKGPLQNQGIGSALLAFCEEYAKEQGYASIYCHARATAISFYLKNHYMVEGEPFDEDGIPHRKLRKIL